MLLTRQECPGLYALMVEDGHGHGQIVHYAATNSEDGNHITSIIQSFKDVLVKGVNNNH